MPTSGQTAEEIRALQEQKVLRLLRYAYERSAFYRRRLDAAGAQPDKIKSLEDYCRAVPLLRKEDVIADQRALPPYGDRLCIDPARIVQINTTGGTSGKGREVYALTEDDTELVSELFMFGCVAAGIRSRDVVAMTFPMSLGGAPLWIQRAFVRLKTNLMCVGNYDTRTKLQMMKEFGVRVLVATPSYIEALASTAHRDLGWDVKRDLQVSIILMATEAFSLERVHRIQDTWGAKVHEWYGTSQRIVAWNCRHGAVRPDGTRGLLHHLPHRIFMETLDPVTHEPVGYGEEGEVVATCLDIQASPLLRYATGDRVRLMPAHSCSCGLEADGYESGTVARFDDMIKVRGINIWPATTDDIVFSIPQVRNYAGTARTLPDGSEQVCVEVEFANDVDGDVRDQVIKRLGADLKSGVGLNIDVVAAQGTLPAFRDTLSKARRWKDERKK
jgi:phenylacetate-CoA ligase